MLLIWLLQCGLVLAIVFLNPNHFTTIDSGYYLESATHLLRGEGYTYTEGGQLVWNGVFPPGYPATISLVSLLTGLSVLWASKVVNLVAGGIFLFLVNHWFGDRAVRIGCVLLLGQFVKLWAHTWSEPLFLVILFSWAYLFFNSQRVWLIFILGILLILVRYAGVFIIPLSLVVAFLDIRRKEYPNAKSRALLGLGWLVGFLSYLYLNHSLSGHWFGGERFGHQETFVHNLSLFAKGLLNELFLFRDTDFLYPDSLFIVGASLQMLLFVYAAKTVKVSSTFAQKPTSYLFLTAGSYLVFLFLIRSLSPFDPPGYRLLSPFSFLAIIGLLFLITPRLKNPGTFYRLGVVLLFASWLHLLPQADLEAKLAPVWHLLGL